jgi:hypothetical protein
MHLLFTDPSTAPRSVAGRVIFGALYAIGTAAFFLLLTELGVPNFYDKLLPVPLMNLMVRGIDRFASKRLRGSRAGTPRPGAPWRMHAVATSMWVVVFLALSAVRGVGDRPRGQALPFWQQACRAGSARACEYAEAMTLIYCNNGSGWACNEWGLIQVRANRSPGNAFTRACEQGFTPTCDYLGRLSASAPPPEGEPPLLGDLPIVLRGTKPPLEERDPARLLAIACDQGWPRACTPAS